MMGRKGGSVLEGRPVPVSKGKMESKEDYGGFALHISEIKLVRSIIKDEKNMSITDYCLLLLRSSKRERQQTT